MTQTTKTNKKVLTKVLTVLLWVVVLVLVVIVARLLIGQATGKLTFTFGYALVKVTTESMVNPDAPDGINPNDMILVRKADVADVEVGNVITFYSRDPALNGRLNTHRAVHIEEGTITTRGDHNLINDVYSVDNENLAGIMVRKLPVLTRVMTWLTANYWILAVAVVFMLVLALFGVKVGQVKAEDKNQAIKDELVEQEVQRLIAESQAKQDNAQSSDNSSQE